MSLSKRYSVVSVVCVLLVGACSLLKGLQLHQFTLKDYSEVAQATQLQKASLPVLLPEDFSSMQITVDIDTGSVWGKFETRALTADNAGGNVGEWDDVKLGRIELIEWWPQDLTSDSQASARADYILRIVESEFRMKNGIAVPFREAYALPKDGDVVFFWRVRAF